MTKEQLLAHAETYVDAQLATMALFGTPAVISEHRRRQLIRAAAAIVAPAWKIKL